MPIYEFRCLECGHLFEKLFLSPAQKEEEEICCPQCRSSSFERVISRINCLSRGSSAQAEVKLTTRSCSPGSTCATFELPGPPGR